VEKGSPATAVVRGLVGSSKHQGKPEGVLWGGPAERALGRKAGRCGDAAPFVRQRSRLIFLRHPGDDVGDLNAISEYGDAAGNGERLSPSLLLDPTALQNPHCAAKQANIPAPPWAVMGDRYIISEVGDATGNGERDSPSLLRWSDRSG